VKNFMARLKEDSRLLLILMMVLGVIVLGFFFFWAGLVAILFIGLAVWLVYILFYLRVLFNVSFEFRVIVYIALLLLTLALIYKAVPDKFHIGSNAVVTTVV
jgi:hypothetical protein